MGPTLSDERFHNTGVAWRDGRLTDEGRFAISRTDRDRGAFKTPTLREVSRTALYMHDGYTGDTKISTTGADQPGRSGVVSTSSCSAVNSATFANECSARR